MDAEASGHLAALLQRVAGGWPTGEHRPRTDELASALVDRLAPLLVAASPSQLTATAE